MKSEAYKTDKTRISYKQTSKALTQMRKAPETEWLSEVSYAAQQQSLRNLDSAFTNLFKHGRRYPNFKKKGNGGSARFTRINFNLKKNSLFVSKIKTPIRVAWSRELPSKPSSCTVSQNPSGQWFASFLCEETTEAYPKTDKQIGIDLGIESFATLSDGTKIKQPDSIRESRKKLAKAQKAHSRKKLGSKNREKARVKFARIHQKIVDTRQDFLHKLSSQLVRENQVIAVEDLSVSKMVKNRRLARLISEQGWREFRTMLEYKAEWYGREIIIVDKYLPSSQTCNACGKTNKLTLDKRKFSCECGVTYDRDENAARNILAAGMAVSACGTGVRLPRKRLVVKQESPERAPGQIQA